MIVTAGIPRKPGMSRDDLIATNAAVIKSVGGNIKQYAPDAFVIVITNPLDAMVWAMQKVTGFDPAKVVGMAGVLDSARFRYFLAEEFEVSVEDVTAFVLGGHGDSDGAAGALLDRGRHSAARSGRRWAGRPRSAWMRSSSARATVVRRSWACSRPARPSTPRPPRRSRWPRATLRTSAACCPVPRTSPVSMVSKDLYVGVPVIIGKGGVEKVVEIKMNADEQAMFDKSVASVKSLCDAVKL